MNKELIRRIENIDKFFKKNKIDKKLNSSEEIIFTLLQLLDIRDNDTIFDESFNRMVQKIGIKMASDEKLSEEYLTLIGLFIGEFMTQFYDKSEKDEEVHKFFLEAGEIISKSLDNHQIEQLLDNMIQKMKMLSKNKKMMNNEEIKKVVTEFIHPYFKENLLNRKREEVVSVLLGITTSLATFISVEQLEDLDIEKELIRAFDEPQMLNKKRYNQRELDYALGKKPICNLCEKDYTPNGLKRHLKSCIKNHYTAGDERLIYLVIKGDNHEYYLHVTIKASAKFSDLDTYLRDVWLECCGHMSKFFIKRSPIDMTMSIGDIFPKVDKIEYIYDFGSSTYLYIEFVDEFKGSQPTLIKTLSRNPMPKVKCNSCGSVKVVAVCSSCLGYKGGHLCKKCLPKHECGLDMLLPYVNSPRYGECGYGEWDNTHNFSEEEFNEIYERVEEEELVD